MGYLQPGPSLDDDDSEGDDMEMFSPNDISTMDTGIEDMDMLTPVVNDGGSCTEGEKCVLFSSSYCEGRIKDINITKGNTEFRPIWFSTSPSLFGSHCFGWIERHIAYYVVAMGEGKTPEHWVHIGGGKDGGYCIFCDFIKTFTFSI